jgi:hypothetical protein
MELPQNNIEAHTATAHDDDILKHARATYRPQPEPVRKTSSPRVLEARAKFIGSLLYSLALLALGGIVTGIAYALASPGGTYVVTSGLFLIGGIYFCVAIWNLLKWFALKAARK